MTGKKQRRFNVCYKLAGKSLEAAKMLDAIVQAEMAKNHVPQNDRNLLEIQRDCHSFYAGLESALQNSDPALLAATGLASPAIQVYSARDTHPRAYQRYPEIFSSPMDDGAYYMYAPVDYKDRHFVPEDAIELDEQQEQKAGNLLFAGGWLGNAPIFGQPANGVAVPADFDRTTVDSLSEEFNDAGVIYKAFVASGRSLDLVVNYKQRETVFHTAMKALTDAVENATRTMFPKLKEQVPVGEELRASCSYGYTDKPGCRAEVRLSVRREGKVNIFAAGKTLLLKRNKYYRVTEYSGGEYTVTPNSRTKAGRALKKLFDVVPAKPSLGDYPEFIGPMKTFPYLQTIDGLPLLVYVLDECDRGTAFCPSGALRVSTATYEWLKADEGDANMGTALPPVPEEVKQELAWLKLNIAARQPRKPSPRP